MGRKWLSSTKTQKKKEERVIDRNEGELGRGREGTKLTKILLDEQTNHESDQLRSEGKGL